MSSRHWAFSLRRSDISTAKASLFVRFLAPEVPFSKAPAIRNFASVSRDKQVKAAAICPLSLVARLWVVLVEMSFSVRVHPAPFSPTPNRHAGIGLKMKGGGPGGSRFELVGLLEPQRKEHERHFGPQKEVDFLAHPPLQAQALVVLLRLAGGKGGSADFP